MYKAEMMIRQWSSCIRSILLLVLFIFSTVMAHAQPDRKTMAGTEELNNFNHAANAIENHLLFKALSYHAPYPRHYYLLTVADDGTVFTARIVPDWAVQNSISGKLTQHQLEKVKRMLADQAVMARPVPAFPVPDGQRHLVLVRSDSAGYHRSDYVGLVPADVENMLKFIVSAIMPGQDRGNKK